MTGRPGLETKMIQIVNSMLPMGLGLSLLLALSACTHLNFQTQNVQKHFVFERSWARHTIQEEYLGIRISQVMEPILYNDYIIEGNEIDGIGSYNRKFGYMKWWRHFVGGITASAHLVDKVIYVGSGDGFFYALNADTGETKWSFPIKSEGIGAPLVTEDRVYFLAGNSVAYALKRETGEQIWLYTRNDSTNLTIRGASEPSLLNDTLYLGFSDGFLVALDKNKGVVLWEKKLGTSARFRDVDAKPIIENDRIYVPSYDGQLFCLSAKDGSVNWVNDEGGFTPVTLRDKVLYYTTSEGKIYALDKESGKVIWKRKLNNSVAGQPVFYRGLLVFGEWHGNLRAIDAFTGEDVAEYSTGRGVTSKVTVDEINNRIYVMTSDANLYAFKLYLKPKGVLSW